MSITHSNFFTEADNSLLAFIRLVGCAYFKKHRNAFPPESLLNSFSSSLEQHQLWLDHLRQAILDRVSFEDEMIPSLDALVSKLLGDPHVAASTVQSSGARPIEWSRLDKR